MTTHQPLEVLLTGGPGGGKTTAMAVLAAVLPAHGISVVTVPEVASVIIGRADFDIASISREDGDANCAFQRDLFMTHRQFRLRALSMASASATPTVILYDRGELDGSAWHDHDCFDELASSCGLSLSGVRDSYGLAFHLVTAALGAEEAYSQANNEARWESRDEAAARDARVHEVWRSHPRLVVVDNATDFAGKVMRISMGITDELGLATAWTPAEISAEVAAPSISNAEIAADVTDFATPVELTGHPVRIAPIGGRGFTAARTGTIRGRFGDDA